MLGRKKSNQNIFELIFKIFSTIGKPFYYFLAFISIGFIFVIYIVGHGINSLIESSKFKIKALLTRLSNIKFSPPEWKIFEKRKQLKTKTRKTKKIKVVYPKFSLPKLFLPRIIFPKFDFSLPNFRLPKFGFPKLKRVKLPKFKTNFGIKVSSKNIKALVIVLFLALIGWFLLLKDLPSATELTTRNQQVSTKIYDRNGVLLYKIYKNQNRSPIELSVIPQSVRLATLAAEDAEFYTHPGFSIRGIIRSIITNAQKGELSGGSTITQQLVKNALLSPEKTLTRKVKELILSLETELTYSKDQILEMYLNEVSYGGTAYGIEEASELYFGKKAGELTIAQASFLAGLPKSPTKYSPYGSNPDGATQRQHDVLNLMFVNKFITKEQLDNALSEDIKLLPNRSDIKAPHFVMYVREQLVEKYGEEVVEKGGLEVTTTLDYEIQKIAEEAVRAQVTKAANLRVGNGAALVLDPNTGEVLAMVGSKDYFDSKNDGQVNVTTAMRQPGSSIKVVNYLYALEHGYTAATILDDSPVTFKSAGTTDYAPKNYDNSFKGRITLRTALAESRNIPAVRVLAGYGVNKMIEKGKLMGITTWTDPTRYGLSLTLGGGEVKLIDLARVFATIANYGDRPDIITITKVVNYRGKTLEENKCLIKKCTTNVADPKAAFILIDILKDNIARSGAFGSNSALVIPGHPEVAVKTGTSNDLKDNLTVGFTKDYLTAVWVGNNDNTPMSRIASGITGAAPIWNEIMKKLLSDKVSENWTVPEGVVQLRCGSRTEWFIKGTEPKNYCQTIEEQKKIDEEKRNSGQILPEAASTSR